MPRDDPIAMEDVQRTFTRILIALYSSPVYRVKCELFRVKPLWPSPAKTNIEFIFTHCLNNVYFVTDKK